MTLADKLGLGPTRTAHALDNGKWRIDVVPPDWSGYSPSSVVLTVDQYRRFTQWNEGKDGHQLIDLLPDLSANDREILLSGINQKEWDSTLGDCLKDDPEADSTDEGVTIIDDDPPECPLSNTLTDFPADDLEDHLTGPKAEE